MSRNIFWWITELIIWYLFFYATFFTIKNINEVSIGWMSFILVFIATLGLFASPLTRHLSIWNNVLDKIIKKEEEREKY